MTAAEAAALHVLADRIRTRLAAHDEPDTDLYRLLHGRGGAWPGLEAVVVDHFAGTLRVGVHEQRDAGWVAALANALSEACRDTPVDGAWLQWRGVRGAPVETLFGTPQARVVGREDGLAVHLRPGEARNAGLFLDARPARAWLRSVASGTRVLNLFAYTCGFSLAALAGGAREAVNVDMARTMLDVGQRNHALNGFEGARFLPHDVFRSRGALRRRGPFDVVVLDPPTFQRGSFEADRDWPRLLARLSELVAPGGRALLCVNSPFITPAQLEAWRTACAPDFTSERRLPASPDFPETEPDRGLKVLVWRRSDAGAGEDVEGDDAEPVR